MKGAFFSFSSCILRSMSWVGLPFPAQGKPSSSQRVRGFNFLSTLSSPPFFYGFFYGAVVSFCLMLYLTSMYKLRCGISRINRNRIPERTI
jgi:hypothetical protein